MIYIYDILANFNETLYDFYDWKTEDTKKGISKIKWQLKRIPWLAHDIGWERILENFRKHFS